MTLRHLRIFQAVAQTGNMTSAAEKLNMTQPPVSQCIKELESHYGVQLFDRLGRGIRLNLAGRALQAYAAHILELSEAAERQLGSLRTGGTLRIGSSMTVGATFLPKLVQQLASLLPTTTLFLAVDNTQAIIDQITSASLDVAIVEGYGEWPALVRQSLCADELILICPPDHPWAQLGTIEVSALAGQRFLARELGSGTRESFEAAMLSHNIPWELAGTINNFEVIIRLVQAGYGCSFIPRSLAEQGMAEARVAIIAVQAMAIFRQFNLVYHRHRLASPALSTMIELAIRLGKERP